MMKRKIKFPVDVEIPFSKGYGDTLQKFFSKLNIPTCKGCEKRRELFNRLFPYKSNDKVNK